MAKTKAAAKKAPAATDFPGFPADPDHVAVASLPASVVTSPRAGVAF